MGTNAVYCFHSLQYQSFANALIEGGGVTTGEIASVG
jgi:hypothetical protein